MEGQIVNLGTERLADIRVLLLPVSVLVGLIIRQDHLVFCVNDIHHYTRQMLQLTVAMQEAIGCTFNSLIPAHIMLM